MFQKYFIVCGNVRSCYKRPAVKQVVKIPTVLIERRIPYAQIRSPHSIEFPASSVKSHNTMISEEVLMFFFQILTNATKPMQLKGTNAIWMPLVLIRRAHTIALVTLITSVMVLIVKVRLTFSMTLNLSGQVLDRPSLNHCRSGGHFWPNKANWSSH